MFIGLDLPHDIWRTLQDVRRIDLFQHKVGFFPGWDKFIILKDLIAWPEDHLEELKTVLAGLPSRPPIPVHISGIQLSDRTEAGYDIWCEVNAPGLGALASEVEGAVSQLGLVPTGSGGRWVWPRAEFSPRLKIAFLHYSHLENLEALRQTIARLQSIDFGRYEVRSFFLYETKWHHGGSEQVKLTEFPLSGGGPRTPIDQHWQKIVDEAAAESGWQAFGAQSFPYTATCSALFAKKGHKLRRITVSVGQQTDDALKAEIIRQLTVLEA
jgi:2'-5' RNA ligase